MPASAALPSLHSQLLRFWLGFGAIAVLLSALSISWLVYIELRSQTLQRAEHIAKLMQTNIESIVDLHALQRLVTSASAMQDVEHIVVVAPSVVLAANRMKWAGHSLDELEVAHLRNELQLTLKNRLVHTHIGTDSVGFTLPVVVNRVLKQEQIVWGAVTIHLHTLDLYQRAIVKGLQSAGMILLIITGYFFLAYARVRYLVLHPLHTLSNTLTQAQQHGAMPLQRLHSLELNTLHHDLQTVFATLASKQAELHRLATIVQSTDQGVTIMDANGHIEWMNRSMERLSGERLQDIRGYLPEQVLHGSSAESLQRLREAIRDGKDVTQEIRHYTKDGQQVWLECRLQAVTQNEQVQYFFAIARNISEHKYMQAILSEERALLAQRIDERTQELTAANQALAKLSELKSQFIASMSHELRTPLNAVLGFAGALQEQRHGELNAYQLRAVNNIDTSGRHLLSIINDILDLSKIEAGKFELHLGRVSIHEVSAASLEFIRSQAAQQQITVSLDVDLALTTMQADERRLRQILINLLSNAVKFTPPGGSVGLEIRPQDDTIVFCVWDTGVGIDEANQTYLFRPFYQLDSSLTRSHDGTGLGLLLSSQFAKLHGGYISLDSTVGKGSRFYVHLPRHATIPTQD